MDLKKPVTAEWERRDQAQPHKNENTSKGWEAGWVREGKDWATLVREIRSNRVWRCYRHD